MAAAENKLVIVVEGDSKGLEKELQNTVKAIQKTSSQAEQIGKTSGNKFGSEFGKGAQSGLRLVTEGFKPIEDAAGVSFSGVANKFQSLLLNPVSAGIALIGTSLFAAFKAAQVGEEIEKINNRFQNLATSAGIVGSKLKEGLVEAAAGLTGTEELLEIASKAIITLGTNAERLPELFVLAQKAVTVFGGTAEGRLEEITRAISNLQTKQLKQIGLNIDTAAAFETYAASIGKVAKDLTEAEQKQALLNAVLTKGAEEFKNVDTEVNKPTISNGLKRLSESFKDLTDAIAAIANSNLGKQFGEALAGIATSISSFAKGIKLLADTNLTVNEEIEKTTILIQNLEKLKSSLNPAGNEAMIAMYDSEIAKLKEKQTELLKTSEAEKQAEIAKAEAAKAAQNVEVNKQATESEIQAEQERLQRIAELKAEARSVELQAEIDQRARVSELENVDNSGALAIQEAKFQQQIENNNRELQLQIEKNNRIKDIEERAQANALAVAKKNAADKKAIGDKELNDARAIAQAKVAIEQNLFATAGALAKQGSDLQKAINIAQAIRNTYTGATLALANIPPPFGAVAAASTVALGLAQVAQIRGANKGALVTGGVPNRDTEPFMLSKGEIVAPAKSFDEVVEGTARQRGFVKRENTEQQTQPTQQINITINGDMIGDDTYINRLVEQIRDAVQFRGADLGV